MRRLLGVLVVLSVLLIATAAFAGPNGADPRPCMTSR